jgi:hypothetical protein
MRHVVMALLVLSSAACGSGRAISDGGGGTGGAGSGGMGGAGSGGSACPFGQLCGTNAPGSGSVPQFHRSVAMACALSVIGAGSPSLYPGSGVACASDDQCKSDGESLGLRCLGGTCTRDECLTDGDCGAGGVCLCSEAGYYNLNHCHRGNCRVDSDCGSGSYCVPSLGGGGCPAEGFYCTTPADTCGNASDCQGCVGEDMSGSFSPSAACHYFSDKHAFGCMQLCRGGC